MKAQLTGIVHGRTIELDAEPGLPEGQRVTVTVNPVSTKASPTDEAARSALMRAAGAWEEDAEELDEYLEWSRQQRKINRPEIPE